MTVNLEFVKGNGFVAEVIRTNRRKTTTVRVQKDKVSVVVPKKFPDIYIEDLVARKTRWIKDKLYLHSHAVATKPKEYVPGESFSYLGRNYRLKILIGSETSVKLIRGKLTVTLPKTEASSERAIEEALVTWYREHADRKLREKIQRFAPVIGVQPTSITVKSFKSRWGSCHINGDIRFNWLIIMAPDSIVDYVVVHELCHLKHYDHSPRFWQCVAQMMSDYKERRQWLKENGRFLTL